MIRMFGHFRLFPFILGVLAALGAMAIYRPEKQVIMQYPHPKDTENKVFRDLNKSCYKYSTHEVDCDANEATMKDYPVQG